jgi:hypothetical protein
MKSAVPFAFAALHADAARAAHRSPLKDAEPELVPEPVRRRRLLRTLHIARTPC